MSADFFTKLYRNTHRRYCSGLTSQVARDMFKIGTKYGEKPKGLGFGLSSRFINTLEETPRSTKKMIVVPWMSTKDFDYEATTYDKRPFDADVVDYKISQEEFDAVLNDLKKNEYWIPQYIFPMRIWLGMLLIPMMVLFLFFMVLLQPKEKTHPLFHMVVLILCPIVAFLNLMSPLFVYKANHSRLVSREKAFEDILVTWNHRVFNDRKVRLKVGKYGCWYEIHFDKDIRNLEEFNSDIIKEVKEELQQEYEEQAKKAGVNVDGQRVGPGAVGCGGVGTDAIRSQTLYQKDGGPLVSPDAEDREVGYAIAAPVDEDEDDLQISSVHLSQPLIQPPPKLS